jgi:dephospho-CoA kinase|tara:strand:- start:2780 stop:3370 length:591 start_codon:yes stop_codon:yes gene_type:complete
MKHIGLTGGIGSGKTTVSKILVKNGIPVYDSDSNAKLLMNSSNEIKKLIINHFGKLSYTNNKLNNKYISKIIFNNPVEMNRINSLIHPFVHDNFNKWKNNFSSKYVIFESAIIFETGSYEKFDFNILVLSDIEKRIKRVINRDFSSEDDVLTRIKSQWIDDKKIPFADYVIKNNKSFKSLENNVLMMIDTLNKKFI